MATHLLAGYRRSSSSGSRSFDAIESGIFFRYLVAHAAEACAGTPALSFEYLFFVFSLFLLSSLSHWVVFLLRAIAGWIFFCLRRRRRTR